MRSGCIESEEASFCRETLSKCMDTHINKPDSLWWCVKSIERVLNLNKKGNKITYSSSDSFLFSLIQNPDMMPDHLRTASYCSLSCSAQLVSTVLSQECLPERCSPEDWELVCTAVGVIQPGWAKDFGVNVAPKYGWPIVWHLTTCIAKG